MTSKETLIEFIEDAIKSSDIVEQSSSIINNIIDATEKTISAKTIKKELLKSLKEML